LAAPIGAKIRLPKKLKKRMNCFIIYKC